MPNTSSAFVNKYRINIKHPDWLIHSTPGKTIELFNAGKLPPYIAGWMLVTSLKHPLRAIYGSDLNAALALLWQAIRNKLESLRTVRDA